jgi:hypothetical protein
VFRIRDMRMRIRTFLFSSVTFKQDANKKYFFFSKFLCLFLFEGTFTSFFRDKKAIKKSQNSRNQGFSAFLLVDGRSRIRKNKLRILIRTNKLQIRMLIQEAKKHTDPEHWTQQSWQLQTIGWIKLCKKERECGGGGRHTYRVVQ